MGEVSLEPAKKCKGCHEFFSMWRWVQFFLPFFTIFFFGISFSCTYPNYLNIAIQLWAMWLHLLFELCYGGRADGCAKY